MDELYKIQENQFVRRPSDACSKLNKNSICHSFDLILRVISIFACEHLFMVAVWIEAEQLSGHICIWSILFIIWDQREYHHVGYKSIFKHSRWLLLNVDICGCCHFCSSTQLLYYTRKYNNAHQTHSMQFILYNLIQWPLVIQDSLSIRTFTQIIWPSLNRT